MESWTAEVEMTCYPRGDRHAVCPLVVAFFASSDGPLCSNCFAAPWTLVTSPTVTAPCSCRMPPPPTAIGFDRATWEADCQRCQRRWRGTHRLGEHGRWELLGPRSTAPHPAGTPAPDWFFDSELTLTGLSSGSISFASSSGRLVTLSVALPGREPEGQLEPFSLAWRAESERPDDITQIVPDARARRRARAVIDTALRTRLDEAMRGEENIGRARAHVNLASRVFDLLD